MSLSRGAVKALVNGAKVENPVLQVVRITAWQERFRLILSDGEFCSQAILTQQLIPLARDGRLVENSVIEVGGVMPSNVKGGIVLILANIKQTFPPPPQGMMGRPVDVATGQPFVPGSGDAAAPAASRPAAAPATKSTSNFYGGSSSAGAVAPPAASNVNIVPLMALNTYLNRFTIKVRVTAKSDIRTWNKPTSSGKLFSVDLLDENGTEIRGTFFNDEVNKYHDMIEVDKVYLISNGRVKVANKRFSALDNDYELSFSRNTTVQMMSEDRRISHIQYNFVPISAVNDKAKGDRVDILGAVTQVRDLQELDTRAGKRTTKRDIEVVDNSGCSIRVTLWGDHANQPQEALADAIIAFKGVAVGEYNGKTLGTWRTTRVDINPDIPEAHKLHGWLQANPDAVASATSLSAGGGSGSGSLTNDVAARKPLSAIVEESLGMGDDKGTLATFKAHVSHIRNNGKSWYPACPLMRESTNGDGRKRNCNKRVVEDGSGSWSCESCQTTVPKPNWRYILSVKMEDYSGAQWMTMFDEAATMIVGKDANTLAEMAKAAPEDDDTSEVDKILQDAQFQEFIVRARIRNERYQDADRLKVVGMYLKPIDYKLESRNLLTAISAFA